MHLFKKKDKSLSSAKKDKSLSPARKVKKRNKNKKKEGISPGLERVITTFTPAEQDFLKLLCSDEYMQSHLFENWPVSKESDVGSAPKRRLVQQLMDMNKRLPGGLIGPDGYLHKARKLLADSKAGVNPLDGWVPSVPTGQAFEIGTPEFEETEALGKKELGKVGFVLVAGGLGERLGYSKIKIGLPTELATETSYLQYYIEYILAVQSKYAKKGVQLPLCIMTSADTNAMTVEFLKNNNNFGMADDQITIVQQGDGVPALLDNDARMVLDSKDPYRVLTKPHGHGDIHALLHEHGVAHKWVGAGIKWISFFQDTNGLAFHTLPLALGVSKKYDLIMNSMTVPRKAKQAIGGIAKLYNKSTKEQRTINVEYNQLDPLLRATDYPEGDVNDEKTGFSPFPGNINQLLFNATSYVAVLEKTKGLMPEFVNPKYKDAAKTDFQKPTRLECMMQDFPTVLKQSEAKQVGFTSASADLCFSPCKNATAEGVKLQAKNVHPQGAASAEADQYGAMRKIMKSIGVNVEDGDEEVLDGIKVVVKPEIVIKPGIALCPSEVKALFPNPDKINISKNSSLVVKGSGKLVFEELKLDGALVIECEEGAKESVWNLWVQNEGWKRVPVENSEDEVIAMRGYKMEKVATEDLVYSVGGYCAPNCSVV